MTRASTSSRCRGLVAQLSRYLDDELPPAQRRTVTAHLRRCPCCQAMAGSLRQTVALCRKAGTNRLPADVRERARRRIALLLSEDQRRGGRT